MIEQNVKEHEHFDYGQINYVTMLASCVNHSSWKSQTMDTRVTVSYMRFWYTLGKITHRLNQWTKIMPESLKVEGFLFGFVLENQFIRFL